MLKQLLIDGFRKLGCENVGKEMIEVHDVGGARLAPSLVKFSEADCVK